MLHVRHLIVLVLCLTCHLCSVHCAYLVPYSRESERNDKSEILKCGTRLIGYVLVLFTRNPI